MNRLSLFFQHYRSTFVGIGIAVLVMLLQFGQVNIIHQVLERADGIVYDLRLRGTQAPRSAGLAEIIIVDLDEHTMAEIGWPWPRAKLGDLIENLANAGVVVIAFDVIFAEPERNPAQEVLSELSHQNINTQNFNYLIDEMDGDKKFIESFGATDVLLGYILQGDDVERGQLPTQVVASNSPIDHKLLVGEYSGYVTSLPIFHAASTGEGFINSSPDPDGFLRKSALLYRYKNKLFPSLSLEAARLYALADQITVKTKPAGIFNNVEGVIIGNELVPTDAESRVLIPYRGPQRSFPYVSAIDVLNNKFDTDIFEGSVVFVGTSAIGLADLRATPMGVQYPGVEIHANVLEGLLQPALLKYRPDWWEAAIALYLALLGLVLSFLLPRLGPVWMALTGLTALVGTIAGNIWIWNNANMALPLVSSLLMIIFLVAYNIGTGFFSEAKKRQQIKSIFNQYVPPAHIDKMLDSPDDVSMDGERKELTVLFSDIRSFTSISEQLSANGLKKLLNRYFDPITEVIFTHQGTVDKYVGDMVMAFWGAPLDDEKHAEHAVFTALEMQRITARLRSEFSADGLPEIYVGVGVNTGEMNVGDMGSTFRRAYTVLGDSVNLGSRLEGLTKFYGVECLVSEFTQAQCPNIQFRTVDKVKVKGKKEAVTILEPLDPEHTNEEKLAQINRYHQAYAHYLKQDWQSAEEILNNLQQQAPEKLYQLYLDRIAQLKQQTLSSDWDGSFTHTSK